MLGGLCNGKMSRRLALGIWWSSSHGVLMRPQAAASPEGEEAKIGTMLSFSIVPFAVDGFYQMVAASR